MKIFKTFKQTLGKVTVQDLAQKEIRLDIADGVATITFNRPGKLNAFTPATVDELAMVFRAAELRDDVGAIVLTGSGRAFCAGADLDELRRIHRDGDQDAGRALVEGILPVYWLMHEARQPVIAALNGPAAGGGANLALACDLRIAGASASLGQVFTRLGLVPDWGGSFFLPRLVGPSRAFELFLSAEMVKAPRLLELGLVNRVVPDDELAAAANAWARQLAAGPPEAIRAIKSMLWANAGADLETLFQLEVDTQVRLFETEDFAEGLRAFAEKRDPHFTGR